MAEEQTIATRASISFATFLWAVIVGMGFRIGWGLIGLIIDLAARAAN